MLRGIFGSGGGAPVGGTGTSSPSTIPRWTGPSTLGDSGLIDDGTQVYTTTRNIGIGTATASAPLTFGKAVFGSPSSEDFYRIKIQDVVGTAEDVGIGSPATGSLGFNWSSSGNLDFYQRNLSATPRMRIDSSGNVGIGTASPRGLLHVGTTASTTDIPVVSGNFAIVRAGSYGTPSVAGLQLSGGFGDVPQVAAWNIKAVASGNAGAFLQSLVFASQASFGGAETERARIDSAGNFGLAVTPSPWNRPSLEIGVAGAGITRDARDLILTANAYIDAGGWKYAANASAGRYDNAIGVHRWFSAASGTAGTAISFTQTMTLNASGQLAIGTGSFTSGCSLTVAQSIDASQSGQGLKLPATPGNADTQTLDCYAEGTWAPTLTGFGGTNPTVNARYTRVGRMVSLQVHVGATGGATFSSTASTTYISLPAGMSPAVSSPGATSNSGIGADGPCVAYTNGNLYLPTFALRSADTFLNVTYTI